MAAPVVDLVVVDFVVVLVYYYMRIIDDVPYLQNWLYIGLSWDAGDYDYEHTTPTSTSTSGPMRPHIFDHNYTI